MAVVWDTAWPARAATLPPGASFAGNVDKVARRKPRAFCPRRFQFGVGRRVPRFPFGGRQHRGLPQQGPHAVAPHFGRRMQPAEGAHPGKMGRQNVLQQARHELQRFELERGALAGGAVTISPAQLARRQELNRPVASRGLEHVTGQIPQRVLARTGRAAVHVPMTFPDLGGHLANNPGCSFCSRSLNTVRKCAPSGLTGRRNLGRAASHCRPFGLRPPPGMR